MIPEVMVVKKTNQGFTLIEAMIFCAIIIILAASAIPAYKNRNHPRVAGHPYVTEPAAAPSAQPPAAQQGTLQEQCVNGYVYIWGPGVIIQKKDDSGLLVHC